MLLAQAYVDACIADGKIPCNFGFYEGKMDGDYRYLLLSPTEDDPASPSQQASATGRIRVVLRGASPISSPPPDVQARVKEVLDFLTACRSRPSPSITAGACTLAERVFIERRPGVGEADLGRWLVFARLFASMRGRDADERDLRDALELDGRGERGVFK